VSTSAGPRDARPREGRTVAVGQAFREAGRFDRAQVSVRAGLIAAIPVAAMLALGTAIGSPSAAVTMGVGAMLAGVAWRAGDGPVVPPIGTMAGATVALGVATLAGTLSGRWPWLHLLLLVIFCLVAGSAASLGRRGVVVGTQSIIAFIVFGRFPENLPNALALTGLVLAGGTAQVLFAAAVAVPLAWRRQRAALAAAYSALAEFTAAVTLSSMPAATALEAAEQVLAAPAFFADPDRDALAALVGEGQRIRLELIGFGTLLTHLRRTNPALVEAASAEVQGALERLRELLALTVAAIDGDQATLAELPAQAAAVREWGTAREPLAAAALDQRLAALIGQVTAAARLAAALHSPGSDGGAIPGRPSLGTRRLGSQLAADVRRMRSGASLHTAAGRHAVRLAVVVALTELLVQRVALPRAYWAVVAASTVLRPSFGQTFTRGAERVLGTMAGVVIATLIAVALDPSGWGVVAVVAVLAWCTYAVFPASFAAGVAMLTGVVVFLLHAISPDTAQTALDRGIDTAIGGAIGLVAYLLWPTWSALSIRPLLATLADVQHTYLDAVLSGLTSGRRMPDAQLRALARPARVAYADAQAAIDLARTEPAHGHGGDLRTDATVLSALRRLVFGVHVLRLDIAALPEPRPLPPLAPLVAGLDQALSALAATLRDSKQRPFPPLRTLHRELARGHPELLSQAVWAGLDELVDATDTAAASVGLTVP
jgi:uncharacterized membrane protein YccC